jgi:hypothetical protein
MDLSRDRVLRAQQVMRQVPKISVHDGFALALAEHHPGCILLSGDGELRKLALEHDMEVHGVLWIIDEIHRCKLTTVAKSEVGIESVFCRRDGPAASQGIGCLIKRYEGLK